MYIYIYIYTYVHVYVYIYIYAYAYRALFMCICRNIRIDDSHVRVHHADISNQYSCGDVNSDALLVS